MRPVDVNRGKPPVPSGYDLAEDSLRAHLEATIGVIDSGSPRMFARVHLYAMRKILNEAEHISTRIQVDGRTYPVALVRDVVPERG